jgi:hypothetical protein
MAQVDTSIAMGFRPIQIPQPIDPTNQLRARMDIEGAMQQQQMNALKMQEYQRARQEENELARIMGNKNLEFGSDAFMAEVLARAPSKYEGIATRAAQRAELAEKVDERKFKNFGRKFDLYKSFVPTINSIDGVTQYVSAAYKDPDLAPILNQIRPFEEALNANQDEYNRDPENWKLNAAGVSPDKIIEIARTRAQEERLRGQEERAVADRTAPKPEKFDLNGKIVTRDMNPNSDTYLQTISTDEKTAAPAAVVESPLAKLVREKTELAAKYPDSPMLKIYDDAIGKETGGAPPALVQEYLYAQKNNGFKGTLLDFKKQVAMAGRSVTNNAAPVQTVTVMGPDGKAELRDARTGRRITDDQGKPLVPFDASTKPLSPIQEQKLRKDRTADNSKIVAAKDMADDVEKNVDALLGNPDKKIPRHPGYSGITGYNALLPSLPSGNARSAQQLLDNVKGKVTVLGKNLASQEGKLGNMAVQEWKIVADALERIDPAAPNFPDQLRSIATQARRLETNLKTRNAELYPAAPSSSGGILEEADAVLRK